MSHHIQEPAKQPCGSCPYRRDAPSGLWHESEYDKLPRFDDAFDPPERVFMCHQQDQRLCAGWVACHDMDQMIGLKIALIEGQMSREVFEAALDYRTPTPVFSSGEEAREHGLSNYESPDERTDRLRKKLLRTKKDVTLG